jgi:drug/metabolite transporter (DMT)-like permease
MATRSVLTDFDLMADVLILAGVVFSATCYVLGAGLTSQMPGWQVISWVVALTLPITLPATALSLWLDFPTSITAPAVGGFVYLGIFSMFLGFFAWYQGLAWVGVEKGSQVQQFQGLLSLSWSALLLGEVVTVTTVLFSLVVIAGVWLSQRAHIATAAPEE